MNKLYYIHEILENVTLKLCLDCMANVMFIVVYPHFTLHLISRLIIFAILPLCKNCSLPFFPRKFPLCSIWNNFSFSILVLANHGGDNRVKRQLCKRVAARPQRNKM